ncbi:MAG: indole-3-glycerol phosphate synthase TrpC [Chloroflexota bacterium]
MSVVSSGTILDRICARTLADVCDRKARVPVSALEQRASRRPRPVDLAEALRLPHVAVIAEIKRASPSRGRFPVDVDPVAVAGEYLAGGAAAISVLTDEPYFQGSLADLEAAAELAHAHSPAVPVLRKDFILDEYQILEALAHGADAILLIVAALEQHRLEYLYREACAAGLSVVVEVHTAEEVERALVAGAEVIGINNRDLRTFQVDLATTERLASLIPADRVVVAESGIFTSDDVRRVMLAGARAILVGESLILSPDRAAAIRSLMDL